MQTEDNPTAVTYPVQVDFNGPLKISRWRVLGNPIMAIPHLILMSVMLSLLQVLSAVAWFAILFTGNIPKGLFKFMAAILRYSWRVTSFYLYMRASYPAFDFTLLDIDTSNDSASLSILYPDRLSRALIFVKWILVIPHLILLGFVGFVNSFMLVIAWFAVLITGKWPEGIRSFVVGTMRWEIRVFAYYYFMTDKYPPFRLYV